MKTILKIFLFAIFLALPFGIRYWQLYNIGSGGYQAPALVEPNLSALDISAVVYKSYDDQPKQSQAHVLIDLGHYNNLQVDDLTPLQERLTARGVAVSYYDEDSDYLVYELRGATAFAVLAPTRSFSLDEIHAVQDFVSRGGLLLLVADPTRSVVEDSSYGYVDLYTLFFPESAVPAVNSLANRFGIQFFEDYLYNLKDYETNFRNVKINDFAAGPLTAGLEQVTLFASHSLQTDGTALLVSGEGTLSNVRSGESGLVAAALSKDEKVLALGDLSLLIAPYHRAADNDRFLSNLADWLSQDQRQWALQDFPYLFRQPAMLTAVSEEALSPAVLNLAGPLQKVFTYAGLDLAWGQSPDADQDVIVAGLFAETDPIKDVLTSAGVSIALAAPEEDEADVDEDEADKDEDEDTSTSDDEDEAEDSVTIEGIGTFELAGLQLFLVSHEGKRTSLTILAEDRDGLSLAVQRLLEQDFEGCATQTDVMLCAADTYADWEESESFESGDNEEESSGNRGDDSVFILLVDSAAGAGRTSTLEWELALSENYNITMWSTSSDGIPAEEDMAGFAAYIIDTGDFAYDSAVINDLPISYLEGNWFLIGEQPGDPEMYELEDISDLTVFEPGHPLAEGLPIDEPILLTESESGVPALVMPAYDEPVEGIEVILVRGPDSAQPETPALQTYDFPDSDTRFALATFAFHRLPEELQSVFAENILNWLLE